jgi:hypothetical protein
VQVVGVHGDKIMTEGYNGPDGYDGLDGNERRRTE